MHMLPDNTHWNARFEDYQGIGTNRLVDHFRRVFLLASKSSDYLPQLKEITAVLAERPIWETFPLFSHLENLMHESAQEEKYELAASYRDMIQYYHLHISE